MDNFLKDALRDLASLLGCSEELVLVAIYSLFLGAFAIIYLGAGCGRKLYVCLCHRYFSPCKILWLSCLCSQTIVLAASPASVRISLSLDKGWSLWVPHVFNYVLLSSCSGGTNCRWQEGGHHRYCRFVWIWQDFPVPPGAPSILFL